MAILPEQKNIAAILPHYTAKGDGTMLLTTDGNSLIFHQRIRSIIRSLVRQSMLDLNALKERVNQNTQKKIMQPLPLSPGLILTAVKVRIPRIHGDSSIGYVNFHAVTATKKHPQTDLYHSDIYLAGGLQVPAIWSESTIRKHLQCARLCSYAPAPTVREKAAVYQADLAPIAEKLVEVIYDILRLKQQ